MAALRFPLLLTVIAVLLSMVAADSETFSYLIVPTRCLDRFARFDFTSDTTCLTRTVSKILGYAIITGACVVKLPQIIRFFSKGSVAGVSRMATYLDLLGYLLQTVYHLTLGSPWSAYGETVIILVQSVLIVLIMWMYDWPGALHATAASALFAVATQAALYIAGEHLAMLQWVTVAFFVVSRAWQIVVNLGQGHTGELAFLTLFMNFAGSAARIFTSSQEVRQIEVLMSFIISTALNGILVLQFVVYTWVMGRKPAAGAVRTPAPAAVHAPSSASASRKKQH